MNECYKHVLTKCPMLVDSTIFLPTLFLFRRETEARKKGISSEFLRQPTSEDDSVRLGRSDLQPLILGRTASSKPARAIQ